MDGRQTERRTPGVGSAASGCVRRLPTELSPFTGRSEGQTLAGAGSLRSYDSDMKPLCSAKLTERSVIALDRPAYKGIQAGETKLKLAFPSGFGLHISKLCFDRNLVPPYGQPGAPSGRARLPKFSAARAEALRCQTGDRPLVAAGQLMRMRMPFWLG